MGKREAILIIMKYRAESLSTPLSARKSITALSIALLVILLLSGCNGNPRIQQQAAQSRANFNRAIAHARSIGVPEAMLKPVVAQATQLGQAPAPLTLFSDQPATRYYTNLDQRYRLLTVQVDGLEALATQQFDYQATLDLQTFEGILAQRQAQGFVEAKTFADQLAHDQKMMAQARYPEQYLQISNSARTSTQALRLMGSAYSDLTSFQQTIKQLQASHLDVTALNQQAQYDLDLFRAAKSPADFSQLIDQINAQLQETVVFSTQAIPYVGAAKLKQLGADIAQMKQYGQNPASFQQRLEADQAALDSARSIHDYLKVSSQIDADTNAIQLPLLRAEASYLLKQYHREVADWGNAHRYHDSFDNNSYNLDYEYDEQGVGSDLDNAVQAAQTLDDYQGAIDSINDEMFNLKAMEADYNDHTPWDQPHATDMQLMQHYKVTSGQVIVVSLIEQTLRLYNNGKLVQAFQITSGQYDKPSPPGFWHIFDRESPTIFKSSEPKGSAFWYPDTRINYAMEYHDGGYFFHDSWWRVNYGVGTNFPHYDTGGDESFAGNGSHGCINMQEQQAAWLYNHTGYGTAVILY
ncbi:MAG TPA: L,D-transpeptidase [Ktedonobacteraceae bacterium]|nr:L,D-transpeptidase [Ktedonobacteraceae bacterium]